MTEFFYDTFVSMLGVLWALTIVLIVSKFTPSKKDKEIEITYEYKFFKYSYREIKRMTEELNALGKDGWDIASLAGEDHYYAYFILKRETLHTTKED